jgi:hypothetical protein
LLVLHDGARVHRLGYGLELAITLALPLISISTLVIVTTVIVLITGHRNADGTKATCCRGVVERSEMWDVLVFLVRGRIELASFAHADAALLTSCVRTSARAAALHLSDHRAKVDGRIRLRAVRRSTAHTVHALSTVCSALFSH